MTNRWIPVKADNDNKISDEELDRILDGGIADLYLQNWKNRKNQSN